jgi:putative CocE/NonD family hydrolase
MWLRGTVFFGALFYAAIGCGATAIARGAPEAAGYEIVVRDVWIAMQDGVRLSATLFIPTLTHGAEKFPAVLEYLPYRKDESKSHPPVHRYFARHGFVSAQVDIRGTGRSEGHAPDREYSQQEQQDAEQVIAWLARQAWSNGNVGMFGISWGGFNSVQMAMRNPPGLKAIIAICATEELFHDDVHFIDGMMHVDEYELNVDLLNAMTRSPDFPTDASSLTERFDNPPWFVMYKQHPRAGAFWDAPVRALESIRVPVFMIGGMLDGYRDSIPRMLERIPAPTRALLGPWNHSEPHEAVPGPAIEWRDQAVEWWTRWLKPHAPHAPDGPKLAVYMNHWYPPDVRIREIPGEWRAEAGWPPKDAHPQTLYLGTDHSLQSDPAAYGRHELAYRPASALEAGGADFWWGDLNGDQRSVDSYSLVYDSAPLHETLSILGEPRVCLQAAASVPSAEWFVRISDAAPDGTATLVSGAGLNGAQRESARTPTPLVPGRDTTLCFDLHLTSWVFPADHRIRVAISNSMWPMIWPTPYSMTTSLRLGGADGSRIDLPVVPDKGPLPVPQFRAQEIETEESGGSAGTPPADLNVSSNVPGLAWIVSRDPVHQQATVEWRGGSSDDYPWGHEETRELMLYRADDLHPETSSVHGEVEMSVGLKERALLWRGILDTRSDTGNFYVQYKRELLENGKIIRSKVWQATVPRDGQ